MGLCAVAGDVEGYDGVEGGEEGEDGVVYVGVVAPPWMGISTLR